ncbi:hypothetical protein AMAG_18722 [Allomyces macrogynus ATCC 38327]|uniref:C2H2-type domain-containing protein n=1 Tax=Allomyces macrogynus (strain ATCC 38327) TaxID=578462 RepID=A0A0L0SEY4_ALLM3|nr:hypothetical protein AMAG_18722 [Allomyces macrogynus ATCC 38327]|eukprot:KNE60992.1 hypothetical protein AMAG_18722 [Allomyces macrogynus ATCC 38327]
MARQPARWQGVIGGPVKRWRGHCTDCVVARARMGRDRWLVVTNPAGGRVTEGKVARLCESGRCARHIPHERRCRSHKVGGAHQGRRVCRVVAEVISNKAR